MHTAKPELEIRTITQPVTLEERSDALPELSGYAAVFNQVIDIWGMFRETIKPGAFTRAIDEKHDVRALVDHNPTLILGRTAAGTLRLEQDEKGLKTFFTPPDTQAGRDIITNIRLGNVNQMSFGFIIKRASWIQEDGQLELRQIEDLDLFDVSIVTYPAYDQTSIGIRAAEKIFNTRSQEKQKEILEQAPYNRIAYLRKMLDLKIRGYR